MGKVDTKKRLFGLRPSYRVEPKGEFRFSVENIQQKKTYWVEKKPMTFKKSGKTYIIWQCTCPSYKNWAWKSHSCKHIDLLMDMGEIK